MSPGNVDNGIRSLMALVRNTFVAGWQGLFAGTTSGIPVSNGAGTITAVAAPTGTIVGTSDTQTLTNKTLTSPTVNGGTLAGGAVTSTGALGFAAGAGGTVTQLTSKTTSVTLNTRCGSITTNNASLASLATVSFTVLNSTVSDTDVILVCVKSGSAAPGSCTVFCSSVASGSFVISIHSNVGTSLSEALVINFIVVEGVTS